MSDDKKLWNDFRRGDDRALSAIYHQNVVLLYRYGQKFTTDNELVEDTIQELFCDLITKKESLGETDNIRYYLLASLRRRLNRNLKSQAGNKENKEREEPNFEIVYSAEYEIINKEELSQREQMVRVGLKKLSPKQREILYYKYTCEFNYAQICKIMNLKYDSARKQLYRALDALKEVLSSNKEMLILFGLFSKKFTKSMILLKNFCNS